MNADLDAVMQAKQRYVIAKTTLEQRLRDDLRKQLANMQSQIDIAVRYAYDGGANKAEILRSLGTKDYRTVYDSLERTQGVERVEGIDPLDSLYTYDADGKRVFVSYIDHGPSHVTGEAVFDVRAMDDGTTWFMAAVPLWNEDYSVRNDVVAVLDGKQDGYYYDEAFAWMRGKLA
tara:strand:- start:399 stop:923 length:525 start_codon:yes stop_codon:yes gene_type:complete